MPAHMPQSSMTADVKVVADEAIGPDERDCARALINAVLAHHELGTDGACVRLTGPSSDTGPALLQVNLRIHGAPARVQVPGDTVAAAISAGAARLERQVRRLTRGGETWPWPDPERALLAVPFEGDIVRIKTVHPHVGPPCQATTAMIAMDYDVHLFTDAETGEDAIVYRAGPTGIRLARQRSMHPPTGADSVALTVNPRRIDTLTPDHAAERLADGWLPFLFFTDLATGRGNLLYRRYDGELTLVRPARQASPQ